jgi:DNA-binding NtrC family response regulator
MSRILVVDDEPAICWGLQQWLTAQSHDVAVASSAEDALRQATVRPPDVVLLDVRLPGIDGLTALVEFRRRLAEVPVIVMTAFGDLDTAVGAVRGGAFDYLAKPFDLQRCTQVVRAALGQSQPLETTDPPALSLPSLTGRSAAIQGLYKQIALAASTDLPVLISGERGTGKDLVARAIHEHSDRRAKPLVFALLAATAETSLETLLFGPHEGDTPSGHAGQWAHAGDGTLVIDDVAQLPPPLQLQLLRRIEAPASVPDSNATRPRVIASTSQPLAKLVSEGAFRDDLYYRLSVVELVVPPLRQRRDDILPLTWQFLRDRGYVDPQQAISHAASELLLARPWAGNVRELRYAIEAATVMARGHAIEPEHLPPPQPWASDVGLTAWDLRRSVEQWALRRLHEPPPELPSMHQDLMVEVEPPLLAAVLRATGGNRVAAAQLLGIHRATLRERLKQYGLDDGAT